MAGIDGVINKIDPPAPLDEDIYHLAPEVARQIGNTPGSLDEAIDALEENHDFLLRGDVFTEDLIRIYIDYKRANEVDYMRLRPHPGEFSLYYDV